MRSSNLLLSFLPSFLPPFTPSNLPIFLHPCSSFLFFKLSFKLPFLPRSSSSIPTYLTYQSISSHLFQSCYTFPTTTIAIRLSPTNHQPSAPSSTSLSSTPTSTPNLSLSIILGLTPLFLPSFLPYFLPFIRPRRRPACSDAGAHSRSSCDQSRSPGNSCLSA